MHSSTHPEAPIEPLEPRIAPATIVILGKTATWTDSDGDVVKLKWSSELAPTFTKTDRGEGLVVDRIDLDPTQHSGATFTLTVKRGGTLGDGRVEIGRLDGAGVAIQSWVGSKGAFSEVDLGNGSQAAKTFVMGSLGQSLVDTWANALGDRLSDFNGAVGLLKINGDIAYGTLNFGSEGDQQHGKLLVTGNARSDLSGGPNGFSIVSRGIVQAIQVGGSFFDTSAWSVEGTVNRFTVGGGIYAKTGASVIMNGGTIDIRGSIIGVSLSGTDVKSVVVGGSLISVDREDAGLGGTISVSGDTNSIVVKGDLRGTHAETWTSFGPTVERVAGAIRVIGSARSIFVGGNIFAGIIDSGDPAINGGITATGNVGSITVQGSVVGNELTPAYILIEGDLTAEGNFAAIGKLTIKGDLIHGYIASGSRIEGGAMDQPHVFTNRVPDAGIGPVTIGGDWVSSNLIAGVKDTGTQGIGFSGDTLEVGDPARIPKLGPVVIKGYLLSDRPAETLSGFAADVIASITVAGRTIFKAGDGTVRFDVNTVAREF